MDPAMKSARAVLISFAFLMASTALHSQSLPSWSRLRFLIGEWIAESGTFSFALDLQQRVLVRRGHSETTTGGKKPKMLSQDDLMIIYAGSGKQPFRAMYFDHLGQVIDYAVTPGRDRVTFLSQPRENAPRYRLTYRRTAKDKLGVLFEVSDSGRDADFKPRQEITARRLFRPGTTAQ